MKKAKKVNKKIRVAELFAGVGGFRIGLEGASKKGPGEYELVWSNQWEPATKKQHASETYINRFGSKGHSNKNIAVVTKEEIPDHDLLVGGFPCQDYSVARTLSHAAGLQGKKGVLWWQIHRILEEKGFDAPKYLMLENVDRLLKSPATQRGRDFAIMLASLNDLGYAVEWRIINAADYGMPQRRRRIFILGYKKGTCIYDKLSKSDKKTWLTSEGVTQNAFPVNKLETIQHFTLNGDLVKLSEKFNNENPGESPFMNSGIAIDRNIYTAKTDPKYNGKRKTLKDILLDESEVPESFFIKKTDLPKWQYLKGAKNEPRKSKNGHEFFYTEGPMTFPDQLDKPSRTIVTGEGGSTPSRFKHVVQTPSGRYRRLTPIELELLCMFPPNHTAGQPDVKRAFFMGNALVVGVVKKLGQSLLKFHLEN